MSERKRILILLGHPDPGEDTYNAALARAYRDGARAAGHDAEMIRVGELDFPILRTKKEFQEGAVPPALEEAQAAVGRADHVVVLFPVWGGTMPAYLKAFLEQVWRPGFAMDSSGRFPKGKLKGKSARVIATMGMPALAYRLLFGGHGVKTLTRAILGFSGFRPVRTSLIGLVESGTAEHRDRWLRRMKTLGAKAI
ncbi:NAD(P)H-dependent oxidoreductase [Parvularcula oceani]|uniref:NAD(P)H-dependent oxidoreductase n=1 Tax=Parvularcula oceani TaxID=1247963 RepID=UPI0004E16839|nr:NAD(P)H-dependent oxidoreductase [Parvularcula oceani]